MKKQLLTLSAASVAALAVAAPVLDGVSLDQNAATRHVTVNYRLTGEPAVVTLTIETNASEGVWVDIGAEHVTRLAGAVNKIVTPDEAAKTIVWGPDADLPDVVLAAGKIRPVLTAWPTNALPDWMSVDLSSPTGLRFYASTNAIPGGIGGRLHKTERLLLRRIPAAGREFLMGAEQGEAAAVQPGDPWWGWTLETPHRVTLTRDYWMGVYPITQEQWYRVKGTRPATFKECEHDDVELHPIENISHDNIASEKDCFLVKLRTASGLETFALPTQAEWEYACRAGVRGGLYTGEEIDTAGDATTSYGDAESAVLNPLAWYSRNSGGRTHAVGQKRPNAWGLYDMLGNVEEWTCDWFRTDLGSADQVDPTVTTAQGDRYYYATYGGHFRRSAHRIRCCCRNGYLTAAECAGFRVICHFGD